MISAAGLSSDASYKAQGGFLPISRLSSSSPTGITCNSSVSCRSEPNHSTVYDVLRYATPELIDTRAAFATRATVERHDPTFRRTISKLIAPIFFSTHHILLAAAKRPQSSSHGLVQTCTLIFARIVFHLFCRRHRLQKLKGTLARLK